MTFVVVVPVHFFLSTQSTLVWWLATGCQTHLPTCDFVTACHSPTLFVVSANPNVSAGWMLFGLAAFCSSCQLVGLATAAVTVCCHLTNSLFVAVKAQASVVEVVATLWWPELTFVFRHQPCPAVLV